MGAGLTIVRGWNGIERGPLNHLSERKKADKKNRLRWRHSTKPWIHIFRWRSCCNSLGRR